MKKILALFGLIFVMFNLNSERELVEEEHRGMFTGAHLACKNFNFTQKENLEKITSPEFCEPGQALYVKVSHSWKSQWFRLEEQDIRDIEAIKNCSLTWYVE